MTHEQKEQKKDTLPADAGADRAPEKSTEGSKPRTRRPLFDAIAEVTGSSPKASGSFVAKVEKALKEEEPPYTPDEVREFGRRFWELCPWAARDGRERPELGEHRKKHREGAGQQKTVQPGRSQRADRLRPSTQKGCRMSTTHDPLTDCRPPQNIEAERALLGGVLRDPDVLFDVLAVVRPERAAILMPTAGSSPRSWTSPRQGDPVGPGAGLYEELRRRKELDDVGEVGVSHGPLGSSPDRRECEPYHARLVQDAAVLRGGSPTPPTNCSAMPTPRR